MPLLIDAYNVLHVVGVLPPELAGIDLEELAALIAGSRFRTESTILVCDGVPKSHRVASPRVEVLFAGPGVKADDLIIRLVQRSSAPKRLTVVTSDHEIARAARRRRAVVLSSEAFLERLAEDQRGRPGRGPSRYRRSSDHPADRRQVEHWLRVFGIDEELLDRLDREPSTLTGIGRDESTDPPPRTVRRTRTPAPTRNIFDARHLDEIRPEDVDRLDMDRLLDARRDARNDDGNAPTKDPI